MFGWPEGQFAWVKSISMMNMILPDRNNHSTFAAAFVCTACFVWLSIILAAYVGHALHHNKFQMIWPLKVLRWLVTLIKTAGPLPAAARSLVASAVTPNAIRSFYPRHRGASDRSHVQRHRLVWGATN